MIETDRTADTWVAGEAQDNVAGGSQGGAGETKTVPSVEYTVIKTVDIESEPVSVRGRDFFKIAPGARSRAVWLLPEG